MEIKEEEITIILRALRLAKDFAKEEAQDHDDAVVRADWREDAQTFEKLHDELRERERIQTSSKLRSKFMKKMGIK